MRKRVTVAAIIVASLAAGGAYAAPISAGGSVAPGIVTSTPTNTLAAYTNVAFTSQAPAGQASTFSGVYSTSVFRDSNNMLCGTAGQCLTFAFQFSNNSSSRDGIETATTGPFSNLFSYNVGYNASNGGNAPVYISDSVNGAISFNFTSQSNTSNLVMPGQSSANLLIQTSAMNFTVGNISFQDNQTATVAGFIPAAAIAAVPEPATWAMMLMGFGMVAGVARYRGRKTSITVA